MRQDPSLFVRPILAPLLLGLSLTITACGERKAEPVEAEEAPTDSAPAEDNSLGEDETEGGSIMRPDIEESQSAEPEPLQATISFAEGGDDLDETAQAALTQLLEDPALVKASWPIVIRSHSDAGGADDVNLAVSRARGEAVAAALTDGGIDERRISVIAFGEQNPLEPNALPDGTPNEAGRAANRRVEITVAPEGWSPSEEDAEEAPDSDEAG